MLENILIILSVIWLLGYFYLLYALFLEDKGNGKKEIDNVLEKAAERMGPSADGLDYNQARAITGLLALVLMAFWPLILLGAFWKMITGQK